MNMRWSIFSMTQRRREYPMKYVPNSPEPGEPKGCADSVSECLEAEDLPHNMKFEEFAMVLMAVT